ncbi:Protein SCAR1, partial [Linum perenne]
EEEGLRSWQWLLSPPLFLLHSHTLTLPFFSAVKLLHSLSLSLFIPTTQFNTHLFISLLAGYFYLHFLLRLPDAGRTPGSKRNWRRVKLTMPLVRFEVRNEFALGEPELYRDANPDDSKAVLDGVAVAGLLGILRQLGDLAEFAAEVFHGLQEEVTSTSSRSYKLKLRVQKIEAVLPPVEKAILAQNSHIHFAYTAGLFSLFLWLVVLTYAVRVRLSLKLFTFLSGNSCLTGSEWHPRIRNEKNHFIYHDLPRFVMDSYEECHDPPRLHLLDKFDSGGSGSCLKRYSDPTLFRRASNIFRESNAEKVHRDKKARKIKKKRSLQKKGGSTRNVSISSRSSRSDFFEVAVDGRTSTSRAASSIEMASKSDFRDYSNSSDSRTRSSHMESGFHPSFSVQPEKLESNEFSPSSLQLDHISNPGFSGEQSGVAEHSFLRDSSPKQIPPISLSVTWDEKEELSDAKSRQHDRDEAPDILNVGAVPNWQELGGVAEIRNLKGLTFEDENVTGPSSSVIVPDDFESEPDNYLDALTTIDAESENDLDYRTKHEVKQVEPIAHDGTAKDGLNWVSAGTSSRHREDDVFIPPDISSNHEMASDLFIPVPSIRPANEKTPDHSQEPSASDSGSGVLASTAADAPDGCDLSSEIAVSGIHEQLPDGGLNSPGKPQESPRTQLSCLEPIQMWTNGGLLGLEPSKPPDFKTSSTAIMLGSEKNTTEVVNFLTPRNDGDTLKPSMLTKEGESTERLAGSKSSASWHDNSVSKAKSSSDSHNRSRFHPYGGELNACSPVNLGNGLPLAKDIRSTSEGACHENNGNPSQNYFGLGHRLFANGFRKKISLVPSCEPELAKSSPQLVVLEQKSGQNFLKSQASPLKAFNSRFEHTSSPPLEQMRLSFQPTHVEACKLRLNFPNGNYSADSSRDMFPSFQLVPEASAELNNVVSDSDDDTFCRSSPYMSDDCPSHRSDTSSEQWEAGQSPLSSDIGACDASHEIPSTESVPSLMKFRETETNGLTKSVPSLIKFRETETNGLTKSVPSLMKFRETETNGLCTSLVEETAHFDNGEISCLSASSLDLPNFDAVHPPLNEVRQEDLDRFRSLRLQYPKTSSQLPPPLPPAQWRVSKPMSDVVEKKPQATFDTSQHAFIPKLVPITRQPKPAPASEPQAYQDEQKLNWEKDANNRQANGKVMNENEDFLQQIRSKSFSLRPTAPTKTNVAETPPASYRVTEILKKANAIQQAVASNVDDDDDTWSDS